MPRKLSVEETLWTKSYGDEDFVYEGYKRVKFCQMYMNGAGCLEGNNCLNCHRYKWDVSLPENKVRCYVCGFKGTKREPPHFSVHCEAPGGGSEYESLQGRVDNGVYSSMLKKGNVDDKRYRFF